MSPNSTLSTLFSSRDAIADDISRLTTQSGTFGRDRALADQLQTQSLWSASASANTLNAVPPDNTLNTATNLGTIAGRVIQTGSVSSTDINDFYRFQVGVTSNLNLTLTGLTADADLYLVRDANNNGIVETTEILNRSTLASNNSETIDAPNLAAGNYFAWVNRYSGTTNYTLTFTLDAAGNTLADARNLGTVTGSRTIRDFVSSTDVNDYYRFQLSATSDVNLSLTGLSADADLYLIQDFNFNGVVEEGEILDYSILLDNNPEAISMQGLTAGNYFIWVNQWSGSTNYDLGMTVTPSEPGNTLLTAAGLGVITGQQSVSDAVSATDLRDIYRFQINATSDLRLTLTNLTNDADLYLIRDGNNNGQIDAGEIIRRSEAIGTVPELVEFNNLAAGTYFVAVDRYAGSTNYTLTFTTDAAGETLSTARNIGVLTNPRSFTDFVGDFDPSDYYRFHLNTTSNLTLNLRGLSADADLYLVRDVNNNGIVDKNDLINASVLTGAAAETLTAPGLAAGSYFVWVSQYTGNTNYILDLAATAVGGLQTLAGSLGADTFTVSQNIAQTIISGNGNVDFGQGGRDVIDLSNILSTSVTLNLAGINGGTGVTYNPGDGTRIFDAINFANGRRILFEGIDSIRFADRTINLSVVTNDPLFSQQWNLHMMGVQQAWRFTTGSTSVAIGIQDTGLGVSSQGLIHPDLRGGFWTGSDPEDDFFRNVFDGSYGPQPISHGTAVQGIIGAISNNGIGISGINWNSTVISADVLDDNPGDLTIPEATLDMINFANNRGQRLVINLSLSAALSPAFEQLVATNSNVLFVISAGNENQSQLGYPAVLAQQFSNVIAVGASWGRSDRNGTARVPGTRISYPGSWGSNYGWGLSLMGPSEVMTTEATPGLFGANFGYDTNFDGTSAAAPNVAGVASLVWSANPNLTATQVHQILAETAFDLGVPGYDLVYGNGFVNADAAVRRALAVAQGAANLANGTAG